MRIGSSGGPIIVVIFGCGGDRSTDGAEVSGRGIDVGELSNLGVKMVMYVVTTVGVGPGTSKMVVRIFVSTLGSLRIWLRLFPTLWTFSRGIH
jgi:hypothetical protein